MLEKPHLFWLFQLRRAGEGTSWEGKRPAGVGGYLVPGWKSAKPHLPQFLSNSSGYLVLLENI